jgi:hypothetical protein
MRLRSDIFVAAYVRLRNGQNAFSVVSRRGAAEAGAIFIKIDRLDGRADLFGPAPQMAVDSDSPPRVFQKISKPDSSLAETEAQLTRELRFDSDIWIIEVEDRAGEPHLDLVYI